MSWQNSVVNLNLYKFYGQIYSYLSLATSVFVCILKSYNKHRSTETIWNDLDFIQNLTMRGFIFDMDGTVIDSTASDYKAWEKAFKEVEVDFPYEDFISLLGAKGSEIVSRYIQLSKEETTTLLEKKEKYFKEISSIEGLHAIEGVEEFLQELEKKNIPAALATGAGSSKLDFVFEKIPIKKYFKTILSAADVQKGKPDPEIFLKAAEKLGLPPEGCTVVEDAVYGIKAAKNAGMKCLAIISTNTPENLKEADLIFRNYQELKQKLELITE